MTPINSKNYPPNVLYFEHGIFYSIGDQPLNKSHQSFSFQTISNTGRVIATIQFWCADIKAAFTLVNFWNRPSSASDDISTLRFYLVI